MKYRVVRGVSVAMKGDMRVWDVPDIISDADAPRSAIKDWLSIGAIEPLGDPDVPDPALRSYLQDHDEDVSSDG